MKAKLEGGRLKSGMDDGKSAWKGMTNMLQDMINEKIQVFILFSAYLFLVCQFKGRFLYKDKVFFYLGHYQAFKLIIFELIRFPQCFTAVFFSKCFAITISLTTSHNFFLDDSQMDEIHFFKYCPLIGRLCCSPSLSLSWNALKPRILSIMNDLSQIGENLPNLRSLVPIGRTTSQTKSPLAKVFCLAYLLYAIAVNFFFELTSYCRCRFLSFLNLPTFGTQPTYCLSCLGHVAQSPGKIGCSSLLVR